MAFHDTPHPTSPDPLDDRPHSTCHIVSVTDPGGTGGDLAFTDGLRALGLPELLLWARPTEGLDPGADWLLTHRERERLLNDWAAELANGRLAAWAERQVWFDGGDTVAVFRFGRAQTASHLNLPLLEPGTSVVSLNWSLLRRAPGPAGTARARPAVERRIERRAAATEALTRSWAQRPAPLAPETDGPVPAGATPVAGLVGLIGPGPLSRWVQARADQVLAAGPDALTGFLIRLAVATTARCDSCLLDELLELATRAKRHPACREASRAATELVFTRLGPPDRPSPIWPRVQSGVPTGPATGFDRQPDLRAMLTDGIEMLMVATVLADVAAPHLTAGATGPWEWAVHEQRLPGREWLAPPAVRRAAGALLERATPDQLAQAAQRARELEVGPEFTGLQYLVSGLQTTAAASARPGTLFRRDQTAGLPRSIVRGLDSLAGQLVTGLAEPDRFPQPAWDLLRHVFGPLAPEAFPPVPTRPGVHVAGR